MPRKIYDILPPGAQKTEPEKPKVVLRKKSSPKIRVVKQSQKIKETKITESIIQKKKFLPKEILVGSSVALLLLCIYLYSALQRAEVQIWPTLEPLVLDETITADQSIETINLSQNVIPATVVEEQLEGQEEFESTGSASNDGKSSGTVRIYNKIEPLAPLTLIKGTHFLSDSGKYFVTLEKVTIPKASYQRGKLVAGYVDVKLQAKEAGEEYNIKPAKFSVPKLSGTSYYYVIWAESDDAMTGGYQGTVKKVTRDDVENAKSSLTKKLFSQAEELLKKKLSPDEVLIENGMAKNVVTTDVLAKEGDNVNKFDVKSKIKISALVFQKQDLEKIIKEKITSQLTGNKNFLEKTLKITHEPELVDVEKGKTKLIVQAKADLYEDIDISSFLGQLSKKSPEEIKSIIENNYPNHISELKVKFWPFWVKKAPKNKDKISVNLQF